MFKDKLSAIIDGVKAFFTEGVSVKLNSTHLFNKAVEIKNNIANDVYDPNTLRSEVMDLLLIAKEIPVPANAKWMLADYRINTCFPTVWSLSGFLNVDKLDILEEHRLNDAVDTPNCVYAFLEMGKNINIEYAMDKFLDLSINAWHSRIVNDFEYCALEKHVVLITIAVVTSVHYNEALYKHDF